MTKDEALDLALEALEYIENNYMSLPKSGSEAITAIKQARALDKKAENARELGLDYEPVAALIDESQRLRAELKFNTPPAAQRQSARSAWVGLTDEEVFETHKQVDSMQYLTFGKAIEAKLREKNGWYRQHVTDGSPCWCEPEISYTNPETGASVVVHKEPQ